MSLGNQSSNWKMLLFLSLLIGGFADKGYGFIQDYNFACGSIWV
jgi:hypothetical protein